MSFAEKGIPAHTVLVAYTYPDYHGLGDSWEKIDYENMAVVTPAPRLIEFVPHDTLDTLVSRDNAAGMLSNLRPMIFGRERAFARGFT